MTEPADTHQPKAAAPAVPKSTQGMTTTIVVIAILLLAALVGVVVWAFSRAESAPAPDPRAAFARYETAWRSAMDKVGIDASFPSEPVRVEQVKPTGRRPFEVAFTAAEVTALMNVYPYEGEQQIGISNLSVGFPSDGVATLDARITVDGTGYSAHGTAPVTYSPLGVNSPGFRELTVDGFGVKGTQKKQASDAVLAYINGYLHAIPGVTIEQARIEGGQLVVRGMAPARIEYSDAEQ